MFQKSSILIGLSFFLLLSGCSLSGDPQTNYKNTNHNVQSGQYHQSSIQLNVQALNTHSFSNSIPTQNMTFSLKAVHDLSKPFSEDTVSFDLLANEKTYHEKFSYGLDKANAFFNTSTVYDDLGLFHGIPLKDKNKTLMFPVNDTSIFNQLNHWDSTLNQQFDTFLSNKKAIDFHSIALSEAERSNGFSQKMVLKLNKVETTSLYSTLIRNVVQQISLKTDFLNELNTFQPNDARLTILVDRSKPALLKEITFLDHALSVSLSVSSESNANPYPIEVKIDKKNVVLLNDLYKKSN